MGRHRCLHPCWHRTALLVGTVLYAHAAGYLALWLLMRPRLQSGEILWVMAGWLVSTWLCKHVLQWRCQGREEGDGRTAAAVLMLLGSATYMTRIRD